MDSIEQLTDFLNQLKNEDRFIIDEDITFPLGFSFPDDGITIKEGSTLIFRDGKIVNSTGSPIVIQGHYVSLIAPPEQIFVGEFYFRGPRIWIANPAYELDHTQPTKILATNPDPAQWTMERAYPQWFGAKDCAADAYSAYNKLKKIKPKGEKYYVKDDYAQLAAQGLQELNDIPDASAAINAAIQLKQRGEVFIPRGWYKISRHINVLPGIKLVGESTSDSGGFLNYGTTLFPWRSSASRSGHSQFARAAGTTDTTVRKSLTDFDFPLHPDQCSWYNNDVFARLNKEIGYMIVTNLKDDNDMTALNYPNTGAYPSGITYTAKQGTPPPETEIRDIRLADLNNIYSTNYKVATHTNDGSGDPANFHARNAAAVEWERQNVHYHPLVEDGVIAGENSNDYDYRFMRGILVAYSVHLKNVHVSGLSQAMSSISSFYSDARHIEGCIYSPPHFNLTARPSGYTDILSFTPDNLSTLYPEKLYAFDIHNFGDALRFHGNHAVTYCDKIGALHLHNCNGGGVFDNILNSDSLIEMCRGISFDSNHIEYGANLTIRSSAVAVRKNFIWRGSRPAIYIYRYKVNGGLHFHSQVEMTGNVFFITWPPEGMPHKASYPNVYDIATDCNASISVDNCFRSSNKHYNGEGSYTGIRIGSFTLGETNFLPPEDGSGLEAFNDFNFLSHISSINSHINGNKVTPMPFTMRRSDFADNNLNIKPYTHDGSSAQWLDPDYQTGDTYSYKAWIFADFRRSIVLRGSVVSIANGNPLMNNVLKSIVLLLGIGTNDYNDKWFGCDLQAGPFVIYVVRNRVRNGAINDTKWLAFPMCSSTQLYDDGKYLGGYPWLSTQPIAESYLNSLAALPIESVKFVGDNVECHCCSAVNLTQGTWTDGDVQYYPDGNDIRKRMYRDGAWHNMK